MSIKRILLLCSLFTGLFPALLSEIKAQNTEDWNYEQTFVYGVNLNSNGGLIGGLGARYSIQTAKNDNVYHSFSLEITDVKHPKEQRTASLITGEFFVPGKQNYLFVVRPQYGREVVLFRKAQDRGVQINAIGAVGPTIGLVAPYLIEYQFPRGFPRTEPYDPEIHTSFDKVLGSGSVGESLSSASINPGLSFKASLVLEVSAFKNSLMGIESGLMLDAFSKEIVIMPFAENTAVFSSVFVTIFYGFGK